MGEGDPGQVEPGAQQIADPGRPLDRQARTLKMSDITIDRAGTDLEPRGQILGPADPPGAQFTDQPEQSLGAANRLTLS